MSSRFSSNYEASELLQNLEEMFPRFYNMDQIFNHTIELSVMKGLPGYDACKLMYLL